MDYETFPVRDKSHRLEGCTEQKMFYCRASPVNLITFFGESDLLTLLMPTELREHLN